MIDQNKGKQKEETSHKRKYTREISPSPTFSDHRHDEFYESSPTRTHRHKDHPPREPRVNFPAFYGKDNVEEYLDWEMKVE